MFWVELTITVKNPFISGILHSRGIPSLKLKIFKPLYKINQKQVSFNS